MYGSSYGNYGGYGAPYGASYGFGGMPTAYGAPAYGVQDPSLRGYPVPMRGYPAAGPHGFDAAPPVRRFWIPREQWTDDSTVEPPRAKNVSGAPPALSGGKPRDLSRRRGRGGRRRRRPQPKSDPRAQVRPEPIPEPAGQLSDRIDNPNRPSLTGNDNFDQVASQCYDEVMQILEQCRATNQKYEDPDFVKSTEGGADSANVFLGEASGGHQWRRLGEMSRNPEIFVGGSEPGDIIQGQLGSCYLLGGLAAMSVVPNLVERVFVAHETDAGVYGIMLYDTDMESWTYVIIDDQVPVEDGFPLYARGMDANELWVSLLEKAYAKKGRNGTSNLYANIAGGRPENAMVHVSGGSANVLMRGEANFSFEHIHSLTQTRRHVLAAGSYETESGIYQGHAYSILEGYEVNGIQLLQLRNPWGNTEWTGAYGDSSPEMDSNLRHQLGHTESDDGTFFISWDDFSRIFGDVSVLTLPAGFETE